MENVSSRISGNAGWITLNRPEALNALTHQMCLDIEATLDRFELDPAVKIIGLESVGDKAFCAGGDLADLYAAAKSGDFHFGRQFWTDEYRLNAKLATGVKPIVSFLQGFTLGGGVGIGCHVPHKIVCETTKIALPEVSLGIIPDVGGTLLLARAPGRCGEYLGTTGKRLSPSDAIFTGFADDFVPFERWSALKDRLSETGDVNVIGEFAESPGESEIAKKQPLIDAHFGGESLEDIVRSLRFTPSEFAEDTLDALSKPCPLAMTCAVEAIHRARGNQDIVMALDLEYRFTSRAAEYGNFVEGIRALIIDKDRSPKWSCDLDSVPAMTISRMLRPLGKDALDLSQPDI